MVVGPQASKSYLHVKQPSLDCFTPTRVRFGICSEGARRLRGIITIGTFVNQLCGKGTGTRPNVDRRNEEHRGRTNMRDSTAQDPERLELI